MPEFFPALTLRVRVSDDGSGGVYAPVWVRFYNPDTQTLTYEWSNPQLGMRLTDRCQLADVDPADQAQLLRATRSEDDHPRAQT